MVLPPAANNTATAGSDAAGQKDFALSFSVKDIAAQNSQANGAEAMPTSSLFTNANDMSGELLMGKTAGESTLQTDATAESILSPAASNAAAENSRSNSSNLMKDSDLFPGVNSTAMAESGPQKSSNLIMPSMFGKQAEIRNRQLDQSSQMPFTEEHWTKSQNSDILNNTENDALDYENDIEIGRSVGAKAKNYDVMDLETGEIYHLVEGTKIQDSEVFAGKGTRNKLNIAPQYAHRHGGKVEDWQHSKGFGVLDTPDGDRPAEIHWMQCSGIGKFDFFVKEWLD